MGVHELRAEVWARAGPLALPDPEAPRDWQHGLPADVVTACLGFLAAGGDRASLAAARLACRALRAAADAAVRSLSVREWPARPKAFARFHNLETLRVEGAFGWGRCSSSGGGSSGGASSSTERPPALEAHARALSALPRLRRLDIACPCPGPSLEALSLLTRLTSLGLVRVAAPPPPPPAAAVAAAAAAAAAAPGRVLQPMPAAFPGGGGDGGAAAGAAAGAVEAADEVDAAVHAVIGAAIDAAAEHAAAAGNGAAAAAPPPAPPPPAPAAAAAAAATPSPAGGSEMPAAVAALTCLEEVRLRDVVPRYEVLAALPGLRRLEVAGRTVALRRGAFVTNGALGAENLSGLTALVVSGNFGVGRLPADIDRLARLVHLDVSKNMLRRLPPAIARLPRLLSLDASSNCLEALPAALPAALTRLDVSNNARVALEEACFRRLPRLRELAACWTWADLAPVFAAADALAELRVLRAVGNGLAALPAAVGGLTALR